MNQQDDSYIDEGYQELKNDPERLGRRIYAPTRESEEEMLGKNKDKKLVDNNIVEPTLYSKTIPTRSSILFSLSALLLVLTTIFQRMVFMAPANPDKNFLFAYQMMATTFSWMFIVTGAGALYTLLTYLNAKESFNAKNN